MRVRGKGGTRLRVVAPGRLELYDLKEDIGEQNNLAADPRYRSLKDSLRQQLEGWMEQQSDKGIETEMRAESRQRPTS